MWRCIWLQPDTTNEKTFWTGTHETLVLWVHVYVWMCMWLYMLGSKEWIWDLTTLPLWRNPSRLPPPAKSSDIPKTPRIHPLLGNHLSLYFGKTRCSTRRRKAESFFPWLTDFCTLLLFPVQKSHSFLCPYQDYTSMLMLWLAGQVTAQSLLQPLPL